MSIAQVDLGVRQNRHQPLEDLAPMAAAVLGAVTRRLRHEGRLVSDGARCGHALERGPPERPPLASLRAFEAAA